MNLDKLLLPFLSGMIALLLLSVGLIIVNQLPLLRIILSTLTPLIAFGVALVGIMQFGEDGLVREDPFHMMNIYLSIALFAFTAGEGAALVISQLSTDSSFYFSIGILLVIGVGFWLLGVLGYLGGINKIMQYLETKYLWLLVFVLSFLGILMPFSLVLFLTGSQLVLDYLIYIPIAIGLTMICISLGIIIATYRNGRLFFPMGFAFIGCLLLLARVFGWLFFSQSHMNELNLLLAAESYLLLGSSVIVSRRIEFAV